MKWFDVEQPSPEWFKLRNGVPTCSRFDMILTPAKGEPSKQHDTLINELIGERMSIIPPEGLESFTNRAMRWGQQCEAEARRYYSLKVDADVFNGGFCLTDDDRFGGSPDGIVGESETVDGEIRLAKMLGGLELKCPQPATQVEYLRAGTLPVAYRWQVHGHLFVTGNEWWDFLSYSPGLPPLLIRVERSPDTIRLAEELERFYKKFMDALAKIQESA